MKQNILPIKKDLLSTKDRKASIAQKHCQWVMWCLLKTTIEYWAHKMKVI